MLRSRACRCGRYAVLLCAASLEAQACSDAPRDPRPADAVEGVLRAFERHRLVGLGEAHRVQEQHDFLVSLLRHPEFARRVDDIVVEFGNARYQQLVDRFIDGDSVAIADVRQAWRNTTAITLWDAPVYERFFLTVREVNAGRPVSERVRVLLGDPPIDWSKLRAGDDVRTWFEENSRNEFFVRVVERDVLARGRRALLIAGTAHLMRPPAAWRREFPEGGPNETGFLEKRHPGSLFVVGVHGPAGVWRDVEARMRTWRTPALVPLRGTWLGRLTMDEELLEHLWDAWLYLGPADSLITSLPPHTLYEREPEYAREVQRRGRLMEDAGLVPTANSGRDASTGANQDGANRDGPDRPR